MEVSNPSRTRETRGRRIPLALQLYSIRDQCATDFDRALQYVAASGFEGVEFAGYYQYEHDAAALNRRLAELGLKVAGAHITARAFQADRLGKTIEFHKSIDCRFLIVSGDQRFTDRERSREYADLMEHASAALEPEGLCCGHHNHAQEFDKDGDQTYWDLFAARRMRMSFCSWTSGMRPLREWTRQPW
jgi:sugar phosphate isomerase/epimerase